jgi:hypothetical protein
MPDCHPRYPIPREKIDLLRTLGAQVRTVPAVPYRDANNYVKLSGDRQGDGKCYLGKSIR